MGRDTVSSARSSCASPSHIFYSSRAVSGAMNIPYKSTTSPPLTTSSTYRLSPTSSNSSISSSSSSSRSRSPATPPSSASSKSFASTAYPDWPQRDILSASFCGHQASSHISDEDLLDLEHLELCDDVRVTPEKTAGISWEATRQPPLVMQSIPSPPRKGRPVSKRSRRSSPQSSKKATKGMSPIVEAPE